MSEIAIGIDLGTSNSCVAVAQPTGVEVLPNAYGEGITASVVALREDGSISVGNVAKANIIHDPPHTVQLGQAADRPVLLLRGGEEGPGDLRLRDRRGRRTTASASRSGTRLFSHARGLGHGAARDEADRRVATSASRWTKAVITVPAYFNDNQRQATKDAGRIAGPRGPAHHQRADRGGPGLRLRQAAFERPARRGLRPRRRHLRHLGARDRQGRVRGARDLAATPSWAATTSTTA